MNLQARTRNTINPRIPRTIPAVAVFVGDVLVILAFVAAGIYSHGGYAWEMPWYTLDVLTPFLIAWILIMPLLGLYHSETLTSYTRTLLFVSIGWVLVSIIGGLIRATPYFYGSAPIDFLAVNVLFGLLFLLPWRLAIVWIRRRYGT